MRYAAIISLGFFTLVEFLMRAVFVFVICITMLPAMFLFEDSNLTPEEMLRPELRKYLDRLIDPPPAPIVVDPTKALVEAYAADKLTLTEFENALERIT